jgi:hypothetical protein
MATIDVTEDEYKARRNGSNWTMRQVVLFVVAVVGPAVWALAAGYLVFGTVWTGTFIVLAGVARLATWASDREMSRLFRRDPLARGPFEIELGDDGYTIRVSGNTLNLSAADIADVLDLGDVYRLDHWCGVSARLPKRCLSTHEVAMVAKYKERCANASRPG